MSAIITRFTKEGDVKDLKQTSFHFVGKSENIAIEIKIASNAVVEVKLKEIIEAYMRR